MGNLSKQKGSNLVSDCFLLKFIYIRDGLLDNDNLN